MPEVFQYLNTKKVINYCKRRRINASFRKTKQNTNIHRLEKKTKQVIAGSNNKQIK